MLSTADQLKFPVPKPQLTQAVYLTADQTLLQFVIDYYYRRYSQYFSQSGEVKELGVRYSYSIPSSPKLQLAPLPPQLQALASKANVLCTVDSIELGLTFPDREVKFQCRADILATCFLAGQRLVMKVDKAVASTGGQVDPVASQVLEKAVLPVLVRWLEQLLLPELTQGMGDFFHATATSATVEDGQINAYAQVVAEQQTQLGMALPRVDMQPVPGAGRVRAVVREDAINLVLAALTPDKPFKKEDKASHSVFSGECEVKASIVNPTVDISGDAMTFTMKVKASAKVSGKVAGVGESIKLSGECTVKPVVRLKVVNGGAKVAVEFDLKRSDLDVKLSGNWGPLDFARKSLNKVLNELLDDVLNAVAMFISRLELPVFEMEQLAKTAGLKVDITADELGFRSGTMYGQFTLREQK